MKTEQHCKVAKVVAIAFSMYSKIPMPQFSWEEEERRYAMAAFPLVGLLIDLLEAILFFCGKKIGLPALPLSILLLLLPVLVDGGIHVDGFMDTSDALSSYRTKEERLRILKDPHIGAFAVISLLMLAGLFLCSTSLLIRQSRGIPLFVFAYVRSLSGISVVSFPLATKGGTLQAFSAKEDASCRDTVRGILFLQALLYGGGLILTSQGIGFLALIVSLLIFLYYYRKSLVLFHGITGDVAGWFLCICELAICIVVAVGGFL